MRWFIGITVTLVLAVLVGDIWWFDKEDFHLGANLSLIYMALLVSIFTVRYLTRSQWWVNRIGRNYLVFKIVMTLVLWQVVVATWWDPDFPGRQQIRYLIYSLGAVFAVPLLVSLIREQRADRDIREAFRRTQRSSYQSRKSSSSSGADAPPCDSSDGE